MSQAQFVQALIRLASAAYTSMPIGDKLSRLVSEQVTDHVLTDLALIEDAFNARMRNRVMCAVLDRYGAGLHSVFDAYAAADQTSSAAARLALTTMNVMECHEMLEDVCLFDDAFSIREMLAAFVKVNIDDNLYYQEEGSTNGESSELDFDEFEEWLARIFVAAVWSRQQRIAETACLLDQDGDGDLDADDADDLFDECDVDGSGQITQGELEAALDKRLNEGAAHVVAEKLMTLADKDGSGEISREELREVIEKISSGKANKKDPAEALEHAFDEWLSTIFVPYASAAIKKKKLKAKG